MLIQLVLQELNCSNRTSYAQPGIYHTVQGMTFPNATVSEDVMTGCGKRRKESRQGRRNQTSVRWGVRGHKDTINEMRESA